MGYHIAMKMRYTLTQYNNKIILNKKKPDTREFPGDLVVRIQCFQLRSHSPLPPEENHIQKNISNVISYI